MIIQNEAAQAVPRVSLVGAGPGDPDLITLKALKAIAHADVLLYDALVDKELLKYARPDAQVVYVGKRSGEHSIPQGKLNRLILDYALNYGHVVRLKGGDPFVFGRGFEEMNFLTRHGLQVDVIPGISSSTSLPGLQQIPLTHRGTSDSFWVVTGTTASGDVSPDLYRAAASGATVVVLMGLKQINKIAGVFRDAGKAALPIAIIENGSLPNERVLFSQVENVSRELQSESFSGPVLLIFGEVVALHPEYQRREAEGIMVHN